MKFATVALSVLGVLASAHANNMMECVTSVEDGKDYFPDKVEVTLSEHYTVEYHNTYKIARNTDSGTSYLLYQCGTTPPDNAANQYDAVVPVPLGNFGLHYTVFISYMELLKKRANIAAMAGEAAWIGSPCLKDMVDNGDVTMVSTINNQTLLDSISNVENDLPFFVGVGTENVFTTNFQISEWKETSLLAIFEWVKFFSMFFNEEKLANDLFNERKESIECARENAQAVVSDAKPIVLWGAYSEYCGGWDVAQDCPQYYCELASTCGATLLTSSEGGVDSEICGRKYLTDDEFFELGKDADVWILAAHNIDYAGLLEKYPTLQEFKSVKNKKVYHVHGQGSSAWFSGRKVEPAVVVNDFCGAVGTQNPNALVPHQMTFIRSIEDATASPPICPADVAPKDAPFLARGSLACERIQDSAAASSFAMLTVALLMMATTALA